MNDVGVKVEGLDEFQKDLGTVEEKVIQGVEEGVEWLRSLIVDRTPVDTGYAQSKWGEVERERNGFSFSNPVHYMRVLEDGLYPGIGPKTVFFQGGIYSSQAPGGIVGPIVNNERILSKVANRIVSNILSGIRT